MEQSMTRTPTSFGTGSKLHRISSLCLKRNKKTTNSNTSTIAITTITPLTLENILKDEKQYATLYELAQLRHCSEELDFLLAVQYYNNSHDAGVFHFIKQTFIKVNSSKEVNLTSHARDEVMEIYCFVNRADSLKAERVLQRCYKEIEFLLI
eukprot:Pgem_evm1s4530